LNYDDYNGNEIDNLKESVDNIENVNINQKIRIYTPNNLRKLVFNKLIDQLSKYPDHGETKSILTKRMVSLEETHSMKQKMIWIKKRKNPIKVHVINTTEFCKTQHDQTDCKTFEKLISILKDELDMSKTNSNDGKG
jgi:hypothetical protein